MAKIIVSLMSFAVFILGFPLESHAARQPEKCSLHPTTEEQSSYNLGYSTGTLDGACKCGGKGVSLGRNLSPCFQTGFADGCRDTGSATQYAIQNCKMPPECGQYAALPAYCQALPQKPQPTGPVAPPPPKDEDPGSVCKLNPYELTKSPSDQEILRGIAGKYKCTMQRLEKNSSFMSNLSPQPNRSPPEISTSACGKTLTIYLDGTLALDAGGAQPNISYLQDLGVVSQGIRYWRPVASLGMQPAWWGIGFSFPGYNTGFYQNESLQFTKDTFSISDDGIVTTKIGQATVGTMTYPSYVVSNEKWKTRTNEQIVEQTYTKIAQWEEVVSERNNLCPVLQSQPPPGQKPAPSIVLQIPQSGEANPGEAIQVRWNGFASGARGTLLLSNDETKSQSLTNPYLDSGAPILDAKIPDTMAPGVYTLSLTSNGTTALTALKVKGKPIGPDDSNAVKPPPSNPEQKPAPPPSQDPNVCNPELPRVWQPACATTPQPPKTIPPEQKPVTPPPSQDPNVCNPELPRVWQPACTTTTPPPEPPKSTPPEQKPVSQPPPQDPNVCNPELPRVWQPACTTTTTTPKPPKSTPPEQKPVPPPAPTPPPVTSQPPPSEPKPCDPNLPSYNQQGCIETAPPETKPVTEPVACNPSLPNYSQPGCIETAPPETKPVDTPSKCDPSLPHYSQPNCLD